ncbi:hypothetical protein LLG95_12635, partial [bacterium]|nr:hypothetical protein [bacterium]
SPLPPEAGPADLKDQTWKKYDKGEINTVDEVKAFLKANGRDSIKLRQKYQLAQYRTNVSSFLKSEVLTELESQINSGSISTLEQARSFIQSKGVDVNKLDLKIIIYCTPGLEIPYSVKSDLSDKIEKGLLNTKEELRKVLKDQNIKATFE